MECDDAASCGAAEDDISSLGATTVPGKRPGAYGSFGPQPSTQQPRYRLGHSSKCFMPQALVGPQSPVIDSGSDRRIKFGPGQAAMPQCHAMMDLNRVLDSMIGKLYIYLVTST